MKKLATLLFLVGSLHAQSDTVRKNISRAQRRVNSKIIRTIVPQSDAQQALAAQPTNGDEALYPDKRASYGKALKQLDSGLIDPTAFAQVVLAVSTNTQANFNAITMGTDPVERKLVDPQSAFAYNLNAADGWIHTLAVPPVLTSAEFAGEMVEVYWMALLRDVPFNEYDTNGTAAAAVADLNNLSDYKAPTPVTTANLFRSDFAGVLDGPYISQFLYLGIPTGPAQNLSNVTTGTAGVDFQAQVVPLSTTSNDFMTTFNEWHFIQQGHNPTRSTAFTGNRFFIRNGRDLAQYVHDCYPIEPYLGAALILNSYGADALDPANPYLNNPTQEAFVTYYLPDVVDLIAMAAEYGLRAAWYQKWLVHRRLRPEFAGFLVNQQKSGTQDFGLNSDVINSAALTSIFSTFGTYFLPQAFPEGSPTHPSYPQGHSTVAGACATILKAFFNENYVIPSPVQPNDANTLLVDYTASTLTVGNELNKLAFNTSIGRDHAGVHYRTDCDQGLLLGEQVAISILEDEAFTRNIPFNGFTLTKFDGTTITIGAKKTTNLLG
jgi:membrane-associated phospholipid phosphatase